MLQKTKKKKGSGSVTPVIQNSSFLISPFSTPNLFDQFIWLLQNINLKKKSIKPYKLSDLLDSKNFF